ncbi:unnamed protein product, partial [Tenebrio molitor]
PAPRGRPLRRELVFHVGVNAENRDRQGRHDYHPEDENSRRDLRLHHFVHFLLQVSYVISDAYFCHVHDLRGVVQLHASRAVAAPAVKSKLTLITTYRKNTAMRLSLLTQNKSHCVGYLEDD